MQIPMPHGREFIAEQPLSRLRKPGKKTLLRTVTENVANAIPQEAPE
jgi:hypothetical protein